MSQSDFDQLQSAASSFLPLLGWSVLPNYATSFLQSVYYGITIRAGEPRPLPQSARYERHRRRIFIFVITSYLLYTLYETFHQIQRAGDLYQVLGVSPFSDERSIRSRFRRLAAQHHPDKIGLDSGSEAYFLYLRRAQETLVDPVKRFAYDRFGPDMTSWGEQKTARDFIMTALTRTIVPQYVGGFIMMVALNWLWWANWGRYWRFYTFAGLLGLELALITQPRAVFMPITYLPEEIRAWLPEQSFYLLPFQILTLARRASITLHIFISQIAPADANNSDSAGDKVSVKTLQQCTQLLNVTRAAEREATRMLHLGQAPFRGDRESVSTLRRGMKEGLILGGVRSSPEVQRAVELVLERSKAEGESRTD